MADPPCTCGHARWRHDEFGCNGMGEDRTHLCGCERYIVAGSLEDILGVWRDQGPFPLRNTDDVALLVDEIVRLRAENEMWRERKKRAVRALVGIYRPDGEP